MNLAISALAVITFLSTMVGGLIALRFKKILPYFFAFASGSLIAVSFFDLLPESLKISESVNLPLRYVMITVVASFLFFSLLERYFLTHHYHEKESEAHGHIMGPVGAGSLVIHSLMDGVAIGAAYQVNSAVGIIVALAVIFHDFTDGINTVTIMLKYKHHVRNATIFLLLDAVAPVAGVFVATAFSVSPFVLSLVLAAFVGEFLYIGAANLLPETRKHRNWKMALAMIAGILLIFTLTSLI
ncbi:ZIP family metal transporter [Candidatus Acetothermia bacterium]|nr:ZIP family metal transporter [Candidatus Acetothermia bacterium]MBI3461104.1 ZIP family metal transporter [Candidatus Acetothermia bacterium]MBI3659743.1 ZIP family metal transporter [Candidatus Acetothermia bacterium]